MFRYKVLKPGFIQKIYREPGGRHDPIVSDVELEPADWYELITGDAPAPSEEAPAGEALSEVAPKADELKRAEIIKDVLNGLDPEDDAHWRKDGEVDLRGLTEKVGSMVKREEVGGFNREEARRLKKIKDDLGTNVESPNHGDIKVLE